MKKYLLGGCVLYAVFGLGYVQASEDPWELGPSHASSDEFKAFKEAADQGDAEAQHMCGVYLEYGEGTTQNFAEAFKYFGMAADQGEALAQYWCGEYLEEGKGAERNLEEALKYYKMAAEQGNDMAQDALERLLKQK
jgi:TPR repeat protein